MSKKAPDGYLVLFYIVCGCIGMCLLALATHYIGVGIAEVLHSGN